MLFCLGKTVSDTTQVLHSLLDNAFIVNYNSVLEWMGMGVHATWCSRAGSQAVVRGARPIT
jgi:hypothetical protein